MKDNLKATVVNWRSASFEEDFPIFCYILQQNRESDLIVFPELMFSGSGLEDNLNVASMSNESITKIHRISMDYDLHIVLGCVEMLGISVITLLYYLPQILYASTERAI